MHEAIPSPTRLGPTGAPSRRALLSVFTALLLAAACATPADLKERDVSNRSPQPIVTRGGAVSEGNAADDLLARVSGEETPTERAQLEKLTDAVRKSLTAPLVAGNRVEALVDGPETFAAIDAAVMAARRHIHIETYIFANDDLGRDFAKRLMEKSRQGVEVRVIYDAVGSLSTPKEFFDSMREAGIEIFEFRPLNPTKTWFWKFNNRDHRKIAIVDGAVAFTGGLNISSAYASSSLTKPGPERGVKSGWRDTHVRVAGPAVEQFQHLFLDTWKRLGGSIRDERSYFPKVPPEGNALVSTVASTNGDEKEEEIYHTYLAAIRNCSKRIWITQAYFAPPAELRDALIAAAKRGVDVRIVVPGFTDSKPILYAAHREYDALLEGGVHLIEQEDALLHAKTALVDDALVFIGSANLDYRSFLHNNEVTAVMVGEQIAQRMAAIFANDARNGHELTLAAWRDRPTLDRFKEGLSGLIKFWL